MATDENDGYTVGLVKKVPFSKEPNWHSSTLSPTILHSLTEFSEKTQYVVRHKDLTVPGRFQGVNADRYLCQLALGAVKETLSKYPDLRDICFTIVNGTSWLDGRASWFSHLDIESVNVFQWQGKIIVGVILAELKATKNSKFYITGSGARHAVMFEYEPNVPELKNQLNILDAVRKTNEGHVFYEFGVAVNKGLLELSDPSCEYPVATALYHDDVIWYVDRPYRHDYIAHAKEYVEARDNLTSPTRLTDVAVQGFLTNHGNFVTRKRGMYQAVKRRMIVDTPSFTVEVTTWNETPLGDYEEWMGGLIQLDDVANGYLIARTSLFSEDLW